VPPTPKPPGQRRRRNAGQSQWKELHESGRQGDPPKLPVGEWLDSTREWWRTIWCSPMATIWVDADVEPLTRLAVLKDEFDRGERNQLTAIQNLEDRYGLSPKARRQLQWEIAKGEVVDLPARQSPRKLRAVEG
jgi:hypothetical protein